MTAALAVPCALFLATVVRSTFGFGEALIAVPLLALVVPVEVAAPVAVLCSITVALLAVAQDWRSIHFGSAGRLVLSSTAGIPIGLLLLKALPGPVAKVALATTIVSFSAYSLAGRHKRELKDDRLAWLFGFGSGVMGGAYGMNGPPLAVYGTLRGWQPQQFRATLQGYFLPASLMGMAGYWLAGLWTPVVTRFFLTALPSVVVGTFIGRAINLRLDAGRFLRWVHLGLVATGVVLALQAFQGL